ncbi:helix-turn-helix domain-containing protein [Fructobacillus cardui]|uniref:helix-turn-helix domain-containing protein n=1 Tax=Fructobacillus cardui TaxID=2893170 RepID=UPI002592B21D|nr:helix-turn-helix transcriptional regulator [uncultured Fructobacillus sp.]CAK1246759.1 DNA-binding transcriptional regulator [Fructobacillus cardui]
MEFGEHLKQVRKQKGMSQQTLSNLLFVTRQTISHWENGKNYPDFNLLICLSDILDLSLDELLREDGKMKDSFTKKDVQGFFKPIYRRLLLADLCFVIILFLEATDVIRLTIWGFIPVVVGSLIVSYVVTRLKRLDRQYQLDMRYTWQKRTEKLFNFIHKHSQR